MHKSVLLDEVISALQIKPDGFYVDGTLGFGGHAEAIAKRLGPHGRLLGLDVDPGNLAAAERRLQPLGNLTRTRQVNFRGLQGVLQEVGMPEVDGMLFDLGVASPHLDTAERGFSFQSEGPLDMRLDPSLPDTALTKILKTDEGKLETLFRDFGETRHGRRLARAVKEEVASGKIKTTKDLSSFCERLIGRHGKTHPATRVFLALRCLVNDELGALSDLLAVAPRHLKVGGRLAVISFHSLEDRLVKQAFKAASQEGVGELRFSLITKKPIVPSEKEERENPRARSAKLRVLERAA